MAHFTENSGSVSSGISGSVWSGIFNQQLDSNKVESKQELKKMFADYNPEFYFMRLFDVDEAINLFAESRNIDLIIAIQKNSSFIGNLLSSSRTKTLTYHSKMPIMIMHE